MFNFETMQSGPLAKFLDGSYTLLLDYLPLTEDLAVMRDLFKDEWTAEINPQNIEALSDALNSYREWFGLRFEGGNERVFHTSTFLQQMLERRADSLEERTTLLRRMGMPDESLEGLDGIQWLYGEIHELVGGSMVTQHPLITDKSNTRLDQLWKFVKIVSQKKGYIKRQSHEAPIGEELVTFAIYFAADCDRPVCLITSDPKTIDIFCTTFKASYEENRRALNKYEKTPVILVDSRKAQPIIDAFSLRHDLYKDHSKFFKV